MCISRAITEECGIPDPGLRRSFLLVVLSGSSRVLVPSMFLTRYSMAMCMMFIKDGFSTQDSQRRDQQRRWRKRYREDKEDKEEEKQLRYYPRVCLSTKLLYSPFVCYKPLPLIYVSIPNTVLTQPPHHKDVWFPHHPLLESQRQRSYCPWCHRKGIRNPGPPLGRRVFQ